MEINTEKRMKKEGKQDEEVVFGDGMEEDNEYTRDNRDKRAQGNSYKMLKVVEIMNEQNYKTKRERKKGLWGGGIQWFSKKTKERIATATGEKMVGL